MGNQTPRPEVCLSHGAASRVSWEDTWHTREAPWGAESGASGPRSLLLCRRELDVPPPRPEPPSAPSRGRSGEGCRFERETGKWLWVCFFGKTVVCWRN